MLRSLSFSLVSLALAGCGPSTAAGTPTDAAADAATADAAVAAPLAFAPVPSAMADQLAAAGLDITHLPAFDTLDGAARDAVMQTFVQATGLECSHCHGEGDPVAARRNRIARRMWDDFVLGLGFADGSAFYCDSCHQGSATFLDRRDTSPTGALATWMRGAYVAPLQSSDGTSMSCASCHGTPYVGDFLDQWGASPPDLGAAVDAGSDGGTSDVDGGGPDMALAGCGKLVTCIDDCGADTRCAGECKTRASAAAKALLKSAQDCSLDDCLRAMRCKSAGDDSADCNACFNNTSSGGATGVACVPGDDPDCGDCAQQWLACEDD